MRRPIFLVCTVLLTLLFGAGVQSVPAISATVPDGSLDLSFNPGAGLEIQGGGVAPAGLELAQQPDGKTLVSGYFQSYAGVPRSGIARVNSDGSLDTTFDPGTGIDGLVTSFALLPNGQILIAGSFSEYDGVTRGSIALVNADGSLDPTFGSGTNGFNEGATAMVRLADGDLIIAGAFTYFGSTPIAGLARLNPDSSLDNSFDPGTAVGANGEILTMFVQPDSRIMIGGAFVSYNSIPRSAIARINPDGSLDTSFQPGQGITDPGGAIVFSIAPIANGFVLGGSFTKYDGNARKNLVQINGNGSLDSSVMPIGTSTDSQINSLAIQPDGKLLIVGNFRFYNGASAPGVARLLPNWQLDAGFNPGQGSGASVVDLLLQPDGKAMIVGYFHAYNAIPRKGIARIVAYTPSPSPSPSPSPVVQALVHCGKAPKTPNGIKLYGVTTLTRAGCHTTAGQAVKVKVRGGLRNRGDIRAYKVIRKNNGKVVIKTYGYRLKLKVVWEAKATGDYIKYKKVKTYKT